MSEFELLVCSVPFGWGPEDVDDFSVRTFGFKRVTRYIRNFNFFFFSPSVTLNHFISLLKFFNTSPNLNLR